MSDSAVVVDVSETHLNLTFAVSGLQVTLTCIQNQINSNRIPFINLFFKYTQLPKTRLTALKKLSAFGHHIKLVTLTYQGSKSFFNEWNFQRFF